MKTVYYILDRELPGFLSKVNLVFSALIGRPKHEGQLKKAFVLMPILQNITKKNIIYSLLSSPMLAHWFLYRIFKLPRVLNPIFYIGGLINSIYYILDRELPGFLSKVNLVFSLRP